MSTPYANDSSMFGANGTPIGWNDQTDSYRQNYGYNNAAQYYLQQHGNEDKSGNYIGGGAGGTAASGAQAGYNQAEQNLQNSYNQVNNANTQNIANRFGGLNTSILSDTNAQANYNMNQAQGALANDYNNSLINNQNTQARTGLLGAQTAQQNLDTQQNTYKYNLNGQLVDLNQYQQVMNPNSLQNQVTRSQQDAAMMSW